MLDPLPRICARVVLRELSVDDLSRFRSYRPAPDSEAWAFLTKASLAELLLPGHWTQIGIADRTTDELIGDIGLLLYPSGDEAEIGFTLHPEVQGRGLGAEAVGGAIALLFQHTTIHRVVGITDARNLRSIRLLERVGMRRVYEQDAAPCGEPLIEHAYHTYSVGRHSCGNQSRSGLG